MAGGNLAVAQALVDRDLDAAEAAGLDPQRRKLLEFVEVCVKYPWHTTDRQLDGLREAGFSDEQIFEAALNAALFMMLTTMADVYHLPRGENAPTGFIGEDIEAWERAGPSGNETSSTSR